MKSTIFGKEILTPLEVATFLNISRRQVYYLIIDAAFNCFEVGNSTRILSSSVWDYVNEQRKEFDRKKGWAD